MSFQGQFKTKALESIWLGGEVLAAARAGTTGNILVLVYDASGDILFATGTDVPTDATSGYAKGCKFIDRDVATGASGVYENIGTNTSCNFDALTATMTEINSVIDGNTATAAEISAVCDDNTATAAEITRWCDVSKRVVSLTGTASITEVLHEGKICVITGTSAANYTLPEATGSGATYRFIINEVNTNNTVFKTADATNCAFYGSVNILDLDAAAQAAYAPAATDDLMTLNGTTTGGAIGDYIEFIDMATDKWMVFGQLQCPTSSNPATPFSGT
jgi:hypothetical protein